MENKAQDKMITKIFPKTLLQGVLKNLKEAGLQVTKLNGGYEVKQKDTLLLKAMNGSNGYLVRYNENLFQR